MIETDTIISFSEVYKWDNCQRQYHYSFNLGLQPEEESDAIKKGVKGHKLLQAFYSALQTGLTKEEAYEATKRMAAKLLEESSQKGIPDFELLTAWTLVDNYITSTEFKATALLVENRFIIPVDMLVSAEFIDENDLYGVQIGFTPDVVFERTGGFCDVEDSKFIGRAWSNAKLNRFPQAKLYEIFLKRMGYMISRSAIRFFNVTTGKIDYKTFVLDPDEESILIYDFMKGVCEVLQYRSLAPEFRAKARRTMNYSNCQFCRFELPCTLEAKGKDATNTLKYLYVKRDYDYSV